MSSCYLIGAVDLNHNGEEALAKRLIDLAIETGLDAVKFQKRTPEKIWTRTAREKPFLSLPEFGKTVGEVYQSLELSFDRIRELRSYANGKIDFLMAPFDQDSLRLAMDLEVDGLKIDPPHITNFPFLKAIAGVNKRIYVSIAACNHADIEQLVEVLRGKDLILLHSVYAKSLPIEETCLGMMRDLRRFGMPVGYSDYSPETIPALVALSLGACALEKPFTLYHHLRGFHHSHSLDTEQLRKFVKEVRALETALNTNGARRILHCEIEELDQERPGLFAARDIKAGEAICPEMLEIKSPGRGLTPRLMDVVIGRKALYDIKGEDPITFGLIEL